MHARFRLRACWFLCTHLSDTDKVTLPLTSHLTVQPGVQALTCKAQLAAPNNPVRPAIVEASPPNAILYQKLKAHSAALTAALIIKDTGNYLCFGSITLGVSPLICARLSTSVPC